MAKEKRWDLISFGAGFFAGGAAHFFIIAALSTSGSQNFNANGYLVIYVGIALALVGVGALFPVGQGLRTVFLFVSGVGVAIFLTWAVMGALCLLGGC